MCNGAVERVKDISLLIRYDTLEQGFLWASAAISILYLTVGYYIVVDPHSISLESAPILVLGLLFMYVGYTTSCRAKFHSRYFAVQSISAAFIGLSFVVLSLVVELVWGSPDEAKKILLIGFFITLMSLSICRTVLFFAVFPNLVYYFWLGYQEINTTVIDLIVSIIKFPLLMVIFYSTVHRFYANVEKEFLKKDQTITRLESDSHIDELTQVKNRKGFNLSLASAVQESEKYGLPFSIVFLDIDFFKEYNDTLGHPAGDRCLKAVASLLNTQCRKVTDTIARVGGEEFALILPSTPNKGAIHLVKKIQQQLSNESIHHPTSSVSSCVTVSAGVASYRTGDDFYSLYERADKAMYRAKMSGRNRFMACCNTCVECLLQRENINEII
ncbi:GGDEF domain-containing protein [Vibrio sp. THAF190c]|uniref:GGDEF domain-containing protein n=1 Tax=Vibrio sp. THAF190c TaxID=2587865 RepID=UPI0012691872|nr:GGDEF domain-containing protein [Vibrio sp. THAF190c]QFT13532.1 Phytochrome-like protein cph2 [Vibrio sp. THAF190c]